MRDARLLLIAIVLVQVTCASLDTSPSAQAQTAPASPGKAEDFMIVDCLLPGHSPRPSAGAASSTIAAMWRGSVAGIRVAPEAGATMRLLTETRAVPGRGLEGDRYFGTGGIVRVGDVISPGDAGREPV